MFRIVRGKLRGDLGIAVTKEAVVGIDDNEAIFDLVHHRIGATRRDDDIFNAVAVQVGDERLDSDEGASRSELFLDEAVVDGGLGHRRHRRRLCGQRQALTHAERNEKKNESWGRHKAYFSPVGAPTIHKEEVWIARKSHGSQALGYTINA
jgi:hypothetical protein